MHQSKTSTSKWSLGCAAFFLLAALATSLWSIWAIITGNWWVRGIALAAVAAVVIRAAYRRHVRRKAIRRAAQAAILPFISPRPKPVSFSPQLTTPPPRGTELNNQTEKPFDVSEITKNLIRAINANVERSFGDGYDQQEFSRDEVAAMLKNNMAIIGNEGGFIIGRSHDEGGIPVLRLRADGGATLEAEFEGYEYLLNPSVWYGMKNDCESINQYHTDKYPGFQPYLPDAGISTLDLRTPDHPLGTKYLVLDMKWSFFVVNKYSTKFNLARLEHMNRLTSYAQFKARRTSPLGR